MSARRYEEVGRDFGRFRSTALVRDNRPEHPASDLISMKCSSEPQWRRGSNGAVTGITHGNWPQ